MQSGLARRHRRTRECDGSEEAAHANPRLFGPLLEAGYLSEPGATVLSTNFEDILNE
ncbi:hypothetical protein [Streptomyces antibioticus]|uniref:hypothetical protein n=1 Tax=Streptomyces antibioticus TaxID=1890 RepID=UPI0036DD9186